MSLLKLKIAQLLRVKSTAGFQDHANNDMAMMQKGGKGMMSGVKEDDEEDDDNDAGGAFCQEDA